MIRLPIRVVPTAGTISVRIVTVTFVKLNVRLAGKRWSQQQGFTIKKYSRHTNYEVTGLAL